MFRICVYLQKWIFKIQIVIEQQSFVNCCNECTKHTQRLKSSMTDVMTACQKEQEIILWWNRYLVICYTPRKKADFLLLFLPLEEKKLSFFRIAKFTFKCTQWKPRHKWIEVDQRFHNSKLTIFISQLSTWKLPFDKRSAIQRW